MGGGPHDGYKNILRCCTIHREERGPSHDAAAAADTHICRYMHTYTGTGTHEPPTMHPHDAHLSGSDVRPEHLFRLSVVRAVRSPSLRASERQSHSARATGRGGAIVVMMVIMPMMGVSTQPYM